MFRPQPMASANPFLQFKWDLIDYETHRFNIRHSKPTITITPPRIFPHLGLRPKKLQAELERATEIQRENRMMMDRIATIYRKGGWTDHKNYHKIRSRNTVERQKQMVKLAYANKVMLARLKDVHTEYNRKRQEDDYQMQRKILSLNAKYNWTQILMALTKEREKIREDYVYPRAGFLKMPGEGKTTKLAKLTALGGPGSSKITKKWKLVKTLLSVKGKDAQKDEKPASIDDDAEKKTVQEDGKDSPLDSDVVNKTAEEDENDEPFDSKDEIEDKKHTSLDSDTEINTVKEDEKVASPDSDAEHKTAQIDENDESLDSDAKNKKPK